MSVYKIFGYTIFTKWTPGLTTEQYNEWLVYDSIDPIGTWRDDFRIAKFEALIRNIVNWLYSKDDNSKVFTYRDFMPKFGLGGQPKKQNLKKQNIQSLSQALLSFASGHNRKIERNERKKLKKRKL